jgi:short-chain fatty acids transporter
MSASEVGTEGRVERMATRFTELSERYVPDAFVFALLATGIVLVLGLVAARVSPQVMVASWGKGFWELIPFSMQMALIIISGYVVATSRPMFRLIQHSADMPQTDRGATLLVALFAMVTSWFNWGFSLIFSAVLAKEICRRRPGVDYRALAASSFLGLGSVWAQGLSGSANLQMCTPEALQPSIREIVARGGLIPDGLIPLGKTVFLWQSLLTVAVEVAVVGVVAWLYTPSRDRARGAAVLGVDLGTAPHDEKPVRPLTPGEWLEHKPWLNLLIAAMGLGYIAWCIHNARGLQSVITLNNINFSFLMLGILLHWTPHRLMKAVRDATPSVWGVLLQYPFYAGIAGMITYSGLNAHIAQFFVSVSSHASFAPLISIYSTILGIFVPSAGSKWVIEAPYVLAAAHDLKVHLGWVVAVYNLGEALANLIQPFWMLPTLAILGLKARDVMGYTFIVFLVLLPVVILMVTALALTLPYPL